MNYNLYSDDRPSGSNASQVNDLEPRQSPRPAARRRGRAKEQGTARNVQVTSVQAVAFAPQAGQKQLLSLKLECYNAAGERLAPVAVQLRTRILHGHVSDGDEVRAVGHWSKGTLKAKAIHDLTTGATVVGRGRLMMWAIPLASLLALVIGGLLIAPNLPPFKKTVQIPLPTTTQAASAAEAGPQHANQSDRQTSEPHFTTPAPNVSAGPANSVMTFSLPDVVGNEVSTATTVLTSRGLKVRVAYSDSSRPKGTVISSNPTPGSTVVEGVTVTLRVSRGVATIAMPNLVDMTLDEAREALDREGWVGELKVVENPVFFEERDGLVSDHTPTAGKKVPRDQVVTVFVDVYDSPSEPTPAGDEPWPTEPRG